MRIVRCLVAEVDRRIHVVVLVRNLSYTVVVDVVVFVVLLLT